MVLAVCFFLKSPKWPAILGPSSRAINCLFASNQTSRYEYSSPAAGGTCLTSCKSAMHLLHLCMGCFQVLTSARLLRSYNALLRVGRQQLATAYNREKNNFQFLRKRREEIWVSQASFHGLRDIAIICNRILLRPILCWSAESPSCFSM